MHMRCRLSVFCCVLASFESWSHRAHFTPVFSGRSREGNVMSRVVASFRLKRTWMWKKTFHFFVDLPSRIRFGAAGGVSTVERSRVHARVIHPVFWWTRRSIGKIGK